MIRSLLLAFALATKPAPLPLAPTGPWMVRTEDDLCLLQRNYKIGTQTVSLLFQPLLDLDQMDLFVIESGSSSGQYEGQFMARIGAGEPYRGRYFSVGMTKEKSQLTRLTADRAILNALKDGDALRIEARPVKETFLIIRPEKARELLMQCIDSLKKSWGIDPEMAARVVVPLEGNPARYFGANSYPDEARQQGIHGRVIALLNIGTTGLVEKCRVVSSAGKLLNEGTCRAAARIRFKPPRDKEGNPLPSTYVLPVNWVM